MSKSNKLSDSRVLSVLPEDKSAVIITKDIFASLLYFYTLETILGKFTSLHNQGKIKLDTIEAENEILITARKL